MMINLCNEMILFYKDTIKKGDVQFAEILRKLDSLESTCIKDHETQGARYCAYGLLFTIVDDVELARNYYLRAKEEFLIVNSAKLAQVYQALSLLPDTN